MRVILIWFSALLSLSCGSSTSPSAMLNLSGAWSGMVGESRSGSALRMTWVVTQTGSIVSGAATLVKPATNIPATGTISGTLSGSQLTLTYSVPAGAVPVYLSCTISGNGTATATDRTIAGTLQLTMNACLGSGLETPESSELSLAKQ